MARQSFFEEQRRKFNDPNFFNRIDLNELEKNVKRIILDVSNTLITEQDFIYFKNDKIISACINKASKECKIAEVTSNALYMYIGSLTSQQFVPMQLNNIQDMQSQREVASAQHVKMLAKTSAWRECLYAFTLLRDRKDLDIPIILGHIACLDRSLLREL